MISGRPNGRPIEILMIEDNPGDIGLAREALKEHKVANKLHVANDGATALTMLRSGSEKGAAIRPDLILLDLNMPVMDGRQVLKELKSDPSLRTIPVVVLTSSEAETDIVKAYESHANCYITKPVDFDQFVKAVLSIGSFWFSVVKLPHEA
jgi:two-component system, chemotaxis family, response regulator Rcp1